VNTAPNDRSEAPAPAASSAARDGAPAASGSRRLAGRLAQGLFASRCALCGIAEGSPVCAGCAADFLPTDLHRCRVCALRLGPAAGDLCGRCLRDPPAFDQTIALADYAAPVDGMVIALKFGHRLDVARVLGALLGRMVGQHTPVDALLAVVPLAYERQRERGFNQALELARAAAAAGGRVLLPQALQRIHHRPAQEGLTLQERRRNVRGAFVVARGEEARLAGREVVVIDDVMTSGSTLDEVARVLRHAGVARVINAVIARTP
jgi:ComF family protein